MAETKVYTGEVQFSDIDVDSGTITVDEVNNRVGILTAAPAVELDVTGDILASGDITSTSGAVFLGNTVSVGAIKWDASNFVGYDGSDWLPLDVQSTTGGGWTDDGAAVRLTSAGDTVTIGNTLTFAKGTQNYLVTDRGTALVFQGQTNGTASAYELFTSDGDDRIELSLFKVGTPADVGDRERLLIQNLGGANEWSIVSEAVGGGTVRPLSLFTTGNANQLHLAINDSVGLGLVPTANMTGLAIEDGLLTLKERATPTADTNYGKIWTESNNTLHFQDGEGTEYLITIAAV